jgi:acetolactate synthase-1/2/3 large subunit
MKRVADYFGEYLVHRGVTVDFTVPGGGAMHLDDAFAHTNGMKCIFMQHEQSAAIAAEAYARLHKEVPLVCVTTGPGGTNTLTGVVGAWLDSIPMLIISGQVRYATTARAAGVPVRAMGDQEFDITRIVAPMTKYAEMLSEPKMAMYHLEKAMFLMREGRPGPVWLDVPLDIQSALIDEKDFVHFDPIKEGYQNDAYNVDDATVDKVIELIKNAKRPVLNAGNGIRIADAHNEFIQVVNLLNIPVVTGWDSIDLIEDENPLYIGRAGLMGDRPGNWAIQNSDLILSVGSRLGVRQVGYDKKKWAREAFVIMVDIDKGELTKPSIHVEMPIQADAKKFLKKLLLKLNGISLKEKNEWIMRCQNWKKDYPVVLPKHYAPAPLANVYCFVKELSRRLPEGRITVVGNGSACVVGSHAFEIKKGQRFIINSGAASMGYDLPAAIGAAIESGEEIICLSGDGSIQMNLQELQTIVHHKLPIKIFVINNDGYHSMRQTESNLFPEHSMFGVGPNDSYDISFPNMEKISNAYGIPYVSIKNNSEMIKLDEILATNGYMLVEIFVDKEQKFEPKSATKKYPDGKLVSPPLEDLAPFLPREELKKIMIVPMLDDGNPLLNK